MASGEELGQTWFELRAWPGAGGAELAAAIMRRAVPAGIVVADQELICYLPGRREADGLGAELAEVAEWAVRLVDAGDWSAWRDAIGPVAAGERIRVLPPWLAPATARGEAPGGEPAARVPAEIPVVVEPGLAFGTGDHPTTRTCLIYLQKHVFPGAVVLDVGTGSGVLAIAAALLGAARVVAIDHDPVACRAARDNLARNPGVGGRVAVVCGDAAALLAGSGRGPAYGFFDLVVANLSTQLIADLAGLLRGVVRPGGRLVLSGVSDERAPVEVFPALAAAGLAIVGRSYERGWLTMLAGVAEGAGA